MSTEKQRKSGLKIAALVIVLLLLFLYFGRGSGSSTSTTTTTTGSNSTGSTTSSNCALVCISAATVNSLGIVTVTVKDVSGQPVAGVLEAEAFTLTTTTYSVTTTITISNSTTVLTTSCNFQCVSGGGFYSESDGPTVLLQPNQVLTLQAGFAQSGGCTWGSCPLLRPGFALVHGSTYSVLAYFSQYPGGNQYAGIQTTPATFTFTG